MQASPVARARGGSTGAPPTLEAVHQLTRQTANLGLTPHPRGGYDGSDRYELVTQEPVRRPLGGNDAAIQPSLAGQRPGARPDPNQARLAAAARPHVAFSPDMTQAQVQTTTAESATGPPERDMRDSEMAAANQFNPPKSMHAGIASATDASVSTIPRIPSCPEPSSNANSRTAGPNDASYPYPHLGPGLAVSGPEPTAAAPAPSIEELLHKASSASIATASPHAPTGQEPVPDGLSKLFNQSAQDNVPEVFHPQRQPPPKHLGKLPGPFAKMDAGSTPFYPHPPAVPVASTHHPQQALASDPNPPAPVPQYTSLSGGNPPGHQHESVPPVPEAMYPSDGRTSAPGGANSAAQNLSGLGSPAQYFASQLQAMAPSQQSAESARAAAQQAPSYPSQPDQAPPGYPFPPMQPSAPLVEANRSPPPAVPHPGTTASPLHRNYSPQNNPLYGAGQVPGSSGTPTRDSTAPTYGYPGSGPAHSLGYNAPSQSRPGVTHLPQSPPPMQSTQSPAQYYHGMASTTSGTTTTAMSAFSPAYSSASPASTTMAHSPTLVYSQPYRPTYAPQPHSQGPSYSVPLPGPSPGTSTQATHYLSQATTQHAQSPYQPITSLPPTQPAVTSAPAYPTAGSYPAPPNHPMASPGHLPPTSMGNVLGQYQSPQPVAQGYTAAAMGANYTAGNLTSPSMPPPQHPPSHPEGGGLQGSWQPGASKPAQTSYSSTSSQVSMEGGYNPGSNQAPYPPPGQTGPSGHHRPIVGHADGPVPGSVPNHAAIPGAYHGQPPHVTAGTSSYAPTPAASNYPAASTSVPADNAPPPGPYPRHPPAGSGPPLGHPSAQATQPYPHTTPGSSTVANQIYAPNHGQSATMQYGGGNQFTVPHLGNVSAASNSTAYGLSPNVTAMQPPQGHYAPPPAGHYNPAAPHAPSSHHPAATGHPAPQQIPGGSGPPPGAPYTAPGSHPVGFTAPPPHTYQSSTQAYPPGPQQVPQAHQQLPPGHNSAGQMPYTAPPHYHPPPPHQHYTHSQASSHAQPPPAQPMATYQTPAPQQPYTHTPAYPGHDGHASSAGSSSQTAAGYPYPLMDPIGHHPSASGPTSGTQPPGPANPQAYYHQPVYQAPTPGTNQHSYSNPPPENPYQNHPSGQGGHSSARNLMD
ncbi:hypothetical protein H4R35_006443 [Dimargaris xerosporica]|nr:hypothetical protein H4R35_006443 [Dimargaris xerosporica]